MRLWLAAALFVFCVSARAAIAYTRFAPAGAGFTLEYPSDWKRQPGVLTVRLKPAGKEGADVRVAVERRPASAAEPKTAKDYVAGLETLEGVKSIEKRAAVDVAGRQAQRLTLVESAELKDGYGQRLPGPLRETHVVVPLKKGYLVLRLEGVGAAYDRALPEFDRIVAKLALSK